MIGTLTLSKLNFVQTLISLIILYKLYSIVTPSHPKPFILENYVHIITFRPDLQAASFYNIRKFLLYSSIIELIIFLILIKG